MTACPVCHQAEHRLKKYDAHTPPGDPRQALRRALRALVQALPAGTPLPGSLAGQAGSPFRGRVRVCTGCGHAVMHSPPGPEGLERYYGRQYWSERPAMEGHEAQRGRHRAVTQVDLVIQARLRAGLGELPTRCLEIGAAWAGATLRLRELAGESLHAAVCEPGEHWSAHYRANGIERVAGFYPFRSAMPFDHIHASHWLEHVLDLESTRRALVEQLEPGGTLFIEVPNCGAPYWELDLADHPHIHFFTADSLRRTFEDGGLQCLECGEYGMSLGQRAAGLPSTEAQHAPNPGGIWLRSVFLKPR